MNINQLAKQLEASNLPPVDQWNPPFCGDIDMIIKRDGTWHYMGSPIGRKALVKLFSNVLKKEDDKFYLVTPVEKVGITVEDAPFVAVLMETIEQDDQTVLLFTDNVGNKFIANSEHPIRVETNPKTLEPSPYILVRKNLEALIHRNVFYQMVDLASIEEIDTNEEMIVESAGVKFSLGKIKA
ncbi:MAG: DUF1285 domain-containing protein [Gammaproteobacteria bacterium]|nr:DUF1285 domain-containing protein [Gammaproteobacteria bacterium]